MKNEAKTTEKIYIKDTKAKDLKFVVSDNAWIIYVEIEKIMDITGFSRKRIYLYAMRKKLLVSYNWKLLLPLYKMLEYIKDNFNSSEPIK